MHRLLAAVAATALTLSITSCGTEAKTDSSAAASESRTAVAQSVSDTQRLVDGWFDLWNGDLSLAQDIIAPEYQVHALSVQGDDVPVKGPDGMAEWVKGVRGAFKDLHYTRTVGPVAQGDMIALRWSVTGTYAGGIPGAKAAVGAPLAFEGNDLLRVADGRIAEYWLGADLNRAARQLKLPLPQ